MVTGGDGDRRATDVDGFGRGTTRFESLPTVEMLPRDAPVHVVTLPVPALVAADPVARNRVVFDDVDGHVLVFAILHTP
jgi:hypothetical protein